MKQTFIIFCFGALGGISRYLISQIITLAHFPIATLIINLLGCFLIAWLGRVMTNNIWKTGLTTGFLGAFTTLSSFNLDVFHLFQTNTLLALTYLLLTIIGGQICIYLGNYQRRAA